MIPPYTTDVRNIFPDPSLNLAKKEMVKFSMRELKVICAELTKVGSTIEADQDVEIKLKFDHGFLTIKQKFLYGKPQTSIQYNDCLPSIKDNFSLQNLTTELNLVLTNRAKQYGDNPPIRKLAYEEVAQTVKLFEDNMKGWNRVKVPQEKGEAQKENIDLKDWQEPRRTMQERWNIKLESIDYVLNQIIRAEEDYEYYMYEASDVPVGMLVLKERWNDLEIDLLVSHPGSEGAGGSMVEYAVKRSIELGKNGKLYVMYLDPDSQQAYLALGFKEAEHDAMTLNPITSTDKWCQDKEGQWRLKSHIDKRYMQGGF